VAAQQSFLSTPRGKLTPALLACVAFLDFDDAFIVNVALPRLASGGIAASDDDFRAAARSS
jgi:hypothetical protein